MTTHNELLTAYVNLALRCHLRGNRRGFRLAQAELLKLGGTLAREERPVLKREACDATA